MSETSLREEKKRLRRELLARRDALTEEEQIRARVLITERILGHQWFYLSDAILTFVNYGSEIQTTEIISEALRLGKKVFVPKILINDYDGQRHEAMEFFQIFALEDLSVGYKGILEPNENATRYEYVAEDAKKTLLLMPGVGFDPFRRRLGYGKGFYDRFLEKKDELWTRSIAIGHACQMTEKLPEEERDVRPYQVILV